MKSSKFGIIIVVLLAILVGGFFAYRVSASSFKEVKLENIDNYLSDIDYGIVYLSEIDDSRKEMLKETIKDTRIEVIVLDVEKVEDVNNYLEKYELKVESLDAYIIYVGGSVEAVIEGKESVERFRELVRWYFFNEIPASEIAYKMPDKALEYEKIINSKKYTVTVLGYASCTHCNLYMPHVNNIASKFGIDIYYFDRDKDINLFEDVRDLGLEIPAKCTSNGEATTTNGNFAKPMTLIIKNGHTVDCIKGNVKEEELEAMLRKYKIIKGGK